MQSKKAQIKLFESIAVLIIFMILIAFGLKFYTNVKISAIKEAERELTEMDSVKTSIILSNLPEITCSASSIAETACLDLFKVQGWNKLLESDDPVFIDYYVPTIGFTEIFVERVYPKEIGEKNSWTIYNATPLLDQMKYSFDYNRIPVVLNNPENEKNQLAVLHIKTYYATQ